MFNKESWLLKAPRFGSTHRLAQLRGGPCWSSWDAYSINLWIQIKKTEHRAVSFSQKLDSSAVLYVFRSHKHVVRAHDLVYDFRSTWPHRWLVWGHGKNDSYMCCWCVLERDDKYGWKIISSFNDWWPAIRRNLLRINKSHLGLNALHWFRWKKQNSAAPSVRTTQSELIAECSCPKATVVLGCRGEERSPEWEGHSPVALCTLRLI